MEPSIEQIQEHFKNAKTIRCLKFNAVIEVSYVTDFVFDKEENAYRAKGNPVTFWRNGTYAEIVKCKKCKNCNCK